MSDKYAHCRKRYYDKNKEALAAAKRQKMSSLGSDYIYFMLVRLRSKAKKKNIPFNLDESDIVIPTHCPVLGCELVYDDIDRSPSVDRIVPSKGYVKGNVVVVSSKANRIKSDATPEEIRMVAEYYTWK